MDRSAPVRITLAIMHHPSRAKRIPALVRACAPLVPQVISDPDPGGPPSPLRTAKRAWAAVDAPATHHVVLQDDVRPCASFAHRLREVLASCPHHAVALYVNSNSPQNSYLVRRAAALGSPWAPLSLVEYTPTLGLAFPADQAAALAAYLADLPDSLRDDDEAVTQFCRREKIVVVAAVPHLLEHGDGPSVAGNDSHGARFATVFADGPLAPGPSRPVQRELESALARRRARLDPTEFVVSLTDSTCLIQFVRPGSGEPSDHWFGWYWQDWADIIGVDRHHLLHGWHELSLHDRGLTRDDCALEVWAAGYLLGADAATTWRHSGAGSPPVVRDEVVLRGVLRSWIDSGLSPEDHRRLGAAGRAELTDVALTAVDQGAARGLDEAPAGPAGSVSSGWGEPLRV